MSWRSRAENISVKMSVHVANAAEVVICFGPRWDSDVQVMSTPSRGLDAEVEFMHPVPLCRMSKSRSGWELEPLSGVLQPTKAVSPA